MAERYGLGYVAEPALPDHGGFVGRLSIAYRTPAGVRGFKFRALDDSEPKYLAPPGQKPRLFNVLDLHGDPKVVAICEGELDTVICSGVLGVPAVGVAGTAMWKPHLPRVFAGVPRVIVIADNDEKEDGRNPGRELAERVARDVEQAVVVYPPKGLDLTEWVQSVGVEGVRKGLGLDPATTSERTGL